jgi:uncharacterized membrane protein YgcG
MTAIIALLLSNCKSIQLESRWLDRPLSFAGKVSEWNDRIVYPKDTKFGIGVMNDDKFLYICMTSWDANVSAQIMRMGFTSMFEPKDGKGKRLGIHYPMGMSRSGLRHEKEEGPEIMKEKLAESLEHIEILGPGKDDTCPTRAIISESMGIITRIAASEGNCIYEMKVPLVADSVNKFAINAGADQIIYLTLATSPADREKTNAAASESVGSGGANMSGAMGGGGIHGGGHGGHGAGGGRSGGIGAMEPFKQSFIIKLSPKPGVTK